MRERVWKSTDQWGNEVIKHRPKPEREFIGRGNEHIVVKSRNGKYVLKYPTPFNYLILRILGSTLGDIRGEITQAEELVEGTSIRVPRTHTLPSTRLYVMGQEFIQNEEGTDIRGTLMEQNAEYLVKKYDSSPDNFAYSNGTAYRLDPTRGRLNRIIDSLGINSDNLLDIKIKTKSFIGNISQSIRRP